MFVDANVLAYATAEPESTRGEACGAIVEAIGDARLAATSSVAVLEELWHLELRGRPPDLEGVTGDAYELLTPLLAVDDRILARALALDLPGLGANDRIHVATCLENGIDTIISTDADFDAITDLRRLDPLDRSAVEELVGKPPGAE